MLLREELGEAFFLILGCGHGFTFKRELLVRMGGFREDLRLTEDTEFLYRFYREGGRAVIAGLSPSIDISRKLSDRQTGPRNIKARLAECEQLARAIDDILSANTALKFRWESYIHSLKQSANQCDAFVDAPCRIR